MTPSHPLVLVSPTSLPSVQSIQEPGWPSGNICAAVTEPSIFHLASLIQTRERVKGRGWSSGTVGKSTPDPSSTQGLLVPLASRKTSEHLSGDQALTQEVREARTCPSCFVPEP